MAQGVGQAAGRALGEAADHDRTRAHRQDLGQVRQELFQLRLAGEEGFGLGGSPAQELVPGPAAAVAPLGAGEGGLGRDDDGLRRQAGTQAHQVALIAAPAMEQDDHRGSVGGVGGDVEVVVEHGMGSFRRRET